MMLVIIVYSIEEKARAEEDVFDMMRQAKQLDVDEYITVIPRICGTLESLSLKCYHNMSKSINTIVSPLLICNSFRSFHSANCPLLALD